VLITPTRDASASAGTGVVVITTRLGYEGAGAAGTGMVITSSGVVLTNNHVIAGATAIRVSVPGRTYAARVVGYDVRDDVAVLQLQRASNLATVSTSTSRVSLRQSVTAIGNAGGSGSLSTAAGTVTDVGRAITAGDQQGNSERLTGLIETDAGVRAGDSGGALLDATGRVVGMVTAASASGAFGFTDAAASDAYAIPIAKALGIERAIVAGKASSAIHVGATAFLGVQVADTDGGALIAGVVAGGPAASAGLTSGDVITAVAGRTVRAASAVKAILLTKKPGATIAVRYLDGAGTHTVGVHLGSGPPQ